MNYDTKAILALEVVDKRETSLNSHIMELEGLQRAIKSVRSNTSAGHIAEIVSDQHRQISSYLCKYEVYSPAFAIILLLCTVVLVAIETSTGYIICFISAKEEPDIMHSYDIWHSAKNLAKKLNAVSVSMVSQIHFIINLHTYKNIMW